MLTYTYHFQNGEKGNIEDWSVNGMFYLTMWRGIAGIALGVILGHVMRYKSELILSNLCLVNAIGVTSIAFTIYLILHTMHRISIHF